MNLFLGIDPGSASGAIAGIDENGSPLFAVDCNGTPAELHQQYLLIRSRFPQDILLAGLEKVHTMPKQGIVSAGKFMENFGAWQMLLLAREIPYELVTPQAWMKVILATAGTTSDGSLEYCKRKYPQLDWKRKKDHNRAEALCLAAWSRQRTYMTL